MKRVYEPAVADGWECCLPVDENDNLTIVETFGRSLAATWTPMRMKILRQDEGGHPWKEADMPWIGEHLLILRPRAVSVLGDLCRQTGELLPLVCDGADLVAWNVTTIVDALDQEKSQVLRFGGGRVMSIKRHYFKPDLVEGLPAFRIPEVRTSIFVGPTFVGQAKAAGLTGTRFKEVWPID